MEDLCITVKEERNGSSIAQFHEVESDKEYGINVRETSIGDASLCKMEFCIKEEPKDSNSAQFQEFKSNTEYGVQTSHPSSEGAPPCKMEEIYISIKEERNNSSSAQFQEFELNDQFSTQMSHPSIGGTPHYKTEEFDVNTTEFSDCSNTHLRMFESNDECGYGTRMDQPPIEDDPLCNMGESQINTEKQQYDCSNTQFQRLTHSVLTETAQGNYHTSSIF